MKKTLYLSDLDGTLLTGKETLSPYTKDTLNALQEKGLLFSFATARSFVTAAKVTKGLRLSCPAVVYNGAFLVEQQTGKILSSACFSPQTAAEIRKTLEEGEISPIVYSLLEGRERFTFLPDEITPEEKAFLETRRDDRRRIAENRQELYEGEIFYFSCIGTKEQLEPVYKKLKEKYNCLYQKDVYSNHQWLEIMEKESTKANAALRLKQLVGAEELVVFGDGRNDLSLFAVADRCYAVENAVPELKKAATAVIDSNENDGVARWLIEQEV